MKKEISSMTRPILIFGVISWCLLFAPNSIIIHNTRNSYDQAPSGELGSAIQIIEAVGIHDELQPMLAREESDAEVIKTETSPSANSRSGLNPDAVRGTTFLSRWDTEETRIGSSYNTQIKLPLIPKGTYDFTHQKGNIQ